MSTKVEGCLIFFDATQVDAIFADAQTQEDYVIGLYKLVYPDWDSIVKINGFPKISKTLSNRIFELAIAWDRIHCPEVVLGGAWMNNGFSSYKVDGIEDGFCLQADYTLGKVSK